MERNARIHLRLPATLKSRVEEYAESRHTSMSALVTHLLTKHLLEEELKHSPPDAEQV